MKMGFIDIPTLVIDVFVFVIFVLGLAAGYQKFLPGWVVGMI